MTAVSIIVPVYNTEPYLRRCLDSLLGQTLRDIEVIAVDDASTDGSAAILRAYEAADRRMRVVTHPENAGLHMARLTGVEAATGAYVGYVDSDDYVSPVMFDVLHRRAVELDADVVRGGAQVYFDSRTAEPVWTTDIRAGDQVFESGVDYLNAAFYPCMWLYLHRRALWTAATPYFPRTRLVGEDNLTAFILAHLARRVALVDARDYFYMERSDSLSGNQSLASALAHIEDRATIVRVLEQFTADAGNVARPALDAIVANNRALLQEFYLAALTDEREQRVARQRFEAHWGA
ncbi:MAG: glycosyltransferase [Vicinamibacterales bacterium]